MPIPALAVGLAVIGVGAAAVHFVCDELSKEELEKQERMKEKYNHYEAEMNRYKEDLERQFNQDLENLTEEDRLMREKLKQDFELKKSELRSLYYNKMRTFVEGSREKRIELKKELNQAVKTTRKQLKHHQSTQLRRQSLVHLHHSLEEALEKVTAYLFYLRKYERYLDICFKNNEEMSEPFQLLLPESFPYVGKLVRYKKKDLFSTGQIAIEKGVTIQYHCVDLLELEEYHEEAEVHVFVESSRNNICTYSVSKGLFKFTALYQPGIGIQTEVLKHERNHIQLKFKGLALRLHKNDLENPFRTPPRKAELRVFPKQWDYNLYHYEPVVTEKYHESFAVCHFNEVPIVFDEDHYADFFEWVNQHKGLWETTNEWKIAPLNEKDIPYVNEVKLQLGTDLIIKADVQQDMNGNSFLFYKGMLDVKEYACNPEDVFVAMKGTLGIVFNEEFNLIDKSMFTEMEQFSFLLFNEFNDQKLIKDSAEGSGFYNKWAEVTDQLITYLYKDGEAYTSTVGPVKYKGFRQDIKMHRFEMESLYPENWKEFLSEKEGNYRQYYFTENGEGSYLPVEFSSTAESIFVYGDFDETDEVQELTVYIKKYPYPEIQQKRALDAFRIGMLTNSRLKNCLLNPRSIDSRVLETTTHPFQNPLVAENTTQRGIVHASLQQEDIYFIQGPPGSGKTTVIQEIIYQHHQQHPEDRILVVSQANVAVDNVLTDLVGQYDVGRMIRCGKTTEGDILPISFEKRYEDYVSSIQALDAEAVGEDLLDHWKGIVMPEDYSGVNSEVGELILRGNSLIGATCVGLAQKRIGLDRLSFDLVIIDEAGKALPAELLIPINRAKKVVLIGDHKQLPPVVNTALHDPEKIELENREYCKNEMFETSLFQRLYERCPGTNKAMLDTQYRMPAVIGSMVSRFFYNDKLHNGINTYEKPVMVFNKHLNWLDMSVDAKYKEDTSQGSPRNEREADVVYKLVQKIKNYIDDGNKIAIITPYKGQKRCIINKFKRENFKFDGSGVVIDTVDAFQGDEADVVMYCTTRSQNRTAFFSDHARLNVAFSRTKSDLLIIGSIKYFRGYGEDSLLYKVSQHVEKNGEVWKFPELLKSI
ncbi:AAA family ATPase [Halobacillus litoralis]|uniref:AAA domain-containing protein n=1 Tax=Halobacillus litoralis TaxID=45668 RepID=UPI001CD27423|nr:AAA domain-containing protein [Halobacillus litoralis]MCA0971351.1 AAA family ATPase [Halobacillus litoralis]